MKVSSWSTSGVSSSQVTPPSSVMTFRGPGAYYPALERRPMRRAARRGAVLRTRSVGLASAKSSSNDSAEDSRYRQQGGHGGPGAPRFELADQSGGDAGFSGHLALGLAAFKPRRSQDAAE